VKALPVTPELLDHVRRWSEPLDDVQRDLVEQTAALGGSARMQVAPEQAPLLTLLVGLVHARRVVEIGTFTGLSSLALVKGLPPDGRLVCFDSSEEWTALARRAWQRAGVADRVELRLGDAWTTLRTLEGEPPVDLAFVDADKQGYPAYVELLLPHLRPGGLLVLDNTLRGGEVLSPDATGDAGALRALNAQLVADPRLETVLLPVADGMTLARKR
jgi:caffeoyl-CoA O-methyltransferase